MAHDARKGAALAARRTYESSLLERLRAEAFALKPTTTEPTATTWEPPAVGDRGAQEVVHWVACLAKQLSAADACAPSAPAGPSSLPRPARPASASASLMRSRSVPVGLMD